MLAFFFSQTTILSYIVLKTESIYHGQTSGPDLRKMACEHLNALVLSYTNSCQQNTVEISWSCPVNLFFFFLLLIDACNIALCVEEVQISSM